MKLCKIALTPPIAAIIVSFGLMFDAFATDYYVSTNGLHVVDGVVWGTYMTDDGVAYNAYTSIQEAISKADAKDTVWVEDGFVCDSGECAPVDTLTGSNRVVLAKAITLRSRSGYVDESDPDDIKGAYIRGKYHSEERPCYSDSLRCVALTAAATLQGFVLENGASGVNGINRGGGGVLLNNANALVTNCIIRNCWAFNGGGINAQSAGTVACCVISNNSAKAIWNDQATGSWEGTGGGLFGSAKLYKCDIIDNWAYSKSGGADWSGAEMRDCLFADNEANGDVGGCKCVSSGRQYIYNTVISNNVSKGSAGGGLCVGYMGDSITTVSDSVITHNRGGNGAGVWSQEDSSGKKGGAILIRCRIENNTASGNGGGLYGARLHVTNCIVRGNTATYGGGVYAKSATAKCDIQVCNTLIADNEGKWSGGVGSNDSSAGSTMFINCTVAGNSANPTVGYSQGGAGAAGSTFVNTVFGGNSGQVDYNSVYAATNCCIRFKSDVDPETKGPGNFDKDPKFVGSGEMPYMIERTSPCRNKGLYDPDDPFFAWMTDGSVGSWALNGVERVSGSKPDLGCYEVKSYGLMMLVR